MSKKIAIVIIVIAALSLCCSAVCIGFVAADYVKDKAEEETMVDQYVMYVGTNDKDTYAPFCTPAEAVGIVDHICLKYFDGYTLEEATGSWVDELHNATHEYTVVCYFDGASKEDVYKAADEILVALNQSTVLIESNRIIMDYYGGK